MADRMVLMAVTGESGENIMWQQDFPGSRRPRRQFCV
jgi:hypothetical protein